jgi:hypothetical protein
VLWGVGAVGLGSGAIFTGRALSARSDWTSQCIDGETLLCPNQSADLVQRDRTASVIADVSWVVGVGAAGAGLIVALGGKKEASDHHLTVGVGPQQLWLSGGF